MVNAVFDALAETLERETGFDRLAARGTLRLTLRAAGLDPSARPAEWVEVVTRLLGGELKSRGVDQPEAVCEKLRLVALQWVDEGESPGASRSATGQEEQR